MNESEKSVHININKSPQKITQIKADRINETQKITEREKNIKALAGTNAMNKINNEICATKTNARTTEKRDLFVILMHIQCDTAVK